MVDIATFAPENVIALGILCNFHSVGMGSEGLASEAATESSSPFSSVSLVRLLFGFAIYTF